MHVFKNRPAIILISCFIMVLVVLFYFYVHISGNLTINCNSVKRLSKLLSVNFDSKIVDIFSQYGVKNDSTRICAFIDETRPLTECEYYRNILEKNGIPRGDIEYFEKMGIRVEDIVQFGVIFNEIRVGEFIAPYSIYWYQIHNIALQKGNIVLLTWIPRKISVNVKDILAENNRKVN